MTLKPFECGPGTSHESVKEYSRILTAAVISSQFRKMLLSDPGKAIASGFGGEVFHLEYEDKNRVASIHAATLADFATEINRIRYLRTTPFSPIVSD